MKTPPRVKKHLAMHLCLRHEPPHVGPADSHDPLNLETVKTRQVDLGFPALAKNMHMSWLVVVGKDHETEAERLADRYHDGR
jgi:hypothetical protein